MNAIIPDTLYGAIVLSVIDFFLSFIIIAGIGVILSLLPLLNRFAKNPDHDGHSHGKKKHRPAHGGHAKSAEAVTGVNNRHVAAISAAVYTVIGPHKIVHVERADK